MSYLGMTATTGRRVDDVAHIRQSVRDILTTPVGTRVMRRDYGSLLPDLIDQPLNGATLLRAYAATVMALVRWEPRIRVSRVQFAIDGGALTIELEATRTDGARAGVDLSIPLRGAAA
ncbi:GPW/gp25 family protein [Denitromonas sp.]|uniref:GPW/gp25 family protein n=1 Tax=Denitromonas sp. TaxID=2734609 RepID=UPI003A8A2CEC